MIEVGSRVKYIKVDTEYDKATGWYPPIGTLGTVKFIDGSGYQVKWDEGTIEDGTWWCNSDAVEEFKMSKMVICKTNEGTLKQLIHDKIDEIFLEMQNRKGITDGRIEPFDALYLDRLEEQLEQHIVRILKYQKGGI
jgi:hypothetical protein